MNSIKITLIKLLTKTGYRCKSLRSAKVRLNDVDIN
jgi:hypothetical protein